MTLSSLLPKRVLDSFIENILMVKNKMNRKTLYKRGFTLIEILAVISIISLMALVALSATSYSGAGAGSKQGAVMASDLFALARSEAIKKQVYVVFLVDATQDPNNPGNFLHRMMVADASSALQGMGPNTVTQLSMWYQLPDGVYYDPTWSTPNTPVPITVNNAAGQLFNGSAYVYTFTPVGAISICRSIGFRSGT